MDDIGNLPYEWKNNDEVITVLGSETSNGSKSHTGYYGVLSVKLDDSIDPQRCITITLKKIPKPDAQMVNGKVLITWDDINNKDVIGYSIYRSENGVKDWKRLNNDIIVGTNFTDNTAEYGKTYYYTLKLVYTGGYESQYTSANSQAVTNSSSKYLEEVSTLPKSYGLVQNSPNPFGTRTEIRYQLPERTQVTLVVYDLSGRLIKTLISKTQNAGYYSILWDGTDASGEKVGTNIYFYRLIAGNFIATRKMNLVK